MNNLYTFIIYVYGYLLHIAAFINPKARKWIEGRKNYRKNFKAEIEKINAKSPHKKWLWFHCASLGEFEQGRTLIEEMYRNHAIHFNICITFFSPSGYEVRKNYPFADLITYLPLDTPGNARYFIEILNPVLIVFVKYELWNNYLREIRKRGIYHILISAKWRKSHRIFHFPLSLFYQKVLKDFSANNKAQLYFSLVLSYSPF